MITADASFALTSLGLAEYGDLKTNAANTVSVAGQLVVWDQANPSSVTQISWWQQV
jgi:hypothetical protein